jgi:hypothetical protein
MFFAGCLLLCGTSFAETSDHVQFMFTVYDNPTCKGEPFAKTPIDTAQSCINYSYEDEGVVYKGSLGHFRCYPDKITFDKYPFGENCVAKDSRWKNQEIVNKDYTVPVSAKECQAATSHSGENTVSERILDYTYGGSEDCKIAR